MKRLLQLTTTVLESSTYNNFDHPIDISHQSYMQNMIIDIYLA